MQQEQTRFAIVKLETFEGRDTYLHCGNDDQDFLFVIVSLDSDGSAEIVDLGYRTFDEAAEAWPEARGNSSKATPKKRQSHKAPRKAT